MERVSTRFDRGVKRREFDGHEEVTGGGRENVSKRPPPASYSFERTANLAPSDIEEGTA